MAQIATLQHLTFGATGTLTRCWWELEWYSQFLGEFSGFYDPAIMLLGI